MPFSFKKTVYFSFVAILMLLLSHPISAQIKYQPNTNIGTSGSVGGGDCCKNAQGNCVKIGTNIPCPGVSNCVPCNQQSNPTTSGWGQAGTGVACSDCDKPLLIDKYGQVSIEKTLTLGGGKLLAGNQGIGIAGNFEPVKANAFNLGSANSPFKTVYAKKIVGQVSKYSDRRLKTDISALPYGLQTVMLLKPSIYHYKNNTEGKRELGLIAQDLQQTVPEVVDESDEFLSVDYAALIPVLIQAIQDQQTLIEAQKSTIEGQKTAMEQTQTELKDLRANLEEIMDFLQLKEKKVGVVED
ncbi:MAG: tail fiber domain-containing protein [Chitinophagales bacterium]